MKNFISICIKNGKIIIGGIIILIFSGIHFYSNFKIRNKNNKILESPNIVSGYFTDLIPGSFGHAGGGRYYFKVGENTFYGSRSDGGRFVKIGNRLFAKSFPVIYNNQTPEKNRILVFPEDFKDFEMSYPDSLSWIKKMLDE